MNDLVRIESVRNGTAEPSVAYEVAFKAISAAVFTIGEVDLSRINEMDNKEAMSGLERISDAIINLRKTKYLFKRYPDIYYAIGANISAMFYAEAVLIPILSLCNKDTTKESVKTKKTYLLKSISTGLVKIGRAICVATRVKTLQNNSGNGIAVLSVIDCDVETQLHQKFKEFRRHGEWFDDSSGSILREFRSMEGRS